MSPTVGFIVSMCAAALCAVGLFVWSSDQRSREELFRDPFNNRIRLWIGLVLFACLALFSLSKMV